MIQKIFLLCSFILLISSSLWGQGALVFHNQVVFVTSDCGGGILANHTHITIRPDGSAVFVLKYSVPPDCIDGGAEVKETICGWLGVVSSRGHTVITPSGKRISTCHFNPGSFSFLLT